MKKENNKTERAWHLLDAKDKILGRLSCEIAILLRGKNKVSFAPNKDEGDFVVVVNAGKIKVTGRKMEQKVYEHYSGYPGGLKTRKYKDVFAKNPAWILKRAVRGMLPDNKLRKPMLSRLKVFAREKHSYQNKFKQE